MKQAYYGRLQEVAGPVSRETFERLLRLDIQFRQWATRINLAAPSTLEDLWERHILDSAQLIRLAPTALRWLDLGSGGGFPGLVMAILMRERRGATVDLIESNRKKAAFLRTAITSAGAFGHVHSCRIEHAIVDNPEIVTARALAPLPLLLEISSRWLTSGAKALYHKGRGYRGELEESRPVWRFDLIEHASTVSPDGVILEISGLQRL